MFAKLIILVAAVVLAACHPGPPAYVPPRAAAPGPKAAPPRQAPAPGQALAPTAPAAAPDPVHQPIVMGDDAKVIRFSGLIPAFARGDRIGEARDGAACGAPVPLIWKGEQSFVSEKEAAKAFNVELAKANYPVADNPDELFQAAKPDPDFLMAGRITNMNLNYCFATKDEGSGDNSITIEWQLFDLLSRRTVYKTTTTGKMHVSMVVPYGEHRLVYGAIADATRALLADAKFHAIVSGMVDLAPPVVTTSFRLHPRPAFSGAIATHMADIQAATVVILAPTGHGSGFFVSADGYLLTNAHVVGESKFVRVRLATGREIAGEAIVVNRIRDVALVKVAETGFAAFPIAITEPQIGSDIFAIGAPLDPKWATTMTRGIVSAYRNDKDGRMIQSDVVIQGGNSGGPLVNSAGNLVGISTSGIGEKSIGINFFIPIHEALKGAGIELADARSASPMRVLERQVAVALQPGRPKPLPKPEPPSTAAAAPVPPPDPVPAPVAVADASQQVASLAPVAIPARRDGDYRAKFTATTINGQSYVDLAISMDGDSIRGLGRTRGGLQCRATGEIAADGTAWINVACSNAGSAYLSWQLSGRFAAEKGGAAYVGRLTYANLNGPPGEAVFRQ